MAITRMNLGPTPHVEVERCNGNLEVRGWDREETRIETANPEDAIIREDGALVSTNGNCTIRMPASGRLIIAALSGNLRLKEIQGMIEIDRIGGSASIRRTGAVQVSSVDGHIDARDVDGTFVFEDIGGHLSVRDVQGMVQGDKIGGHFSARNIPEGARVGEIGGDLAVRTDFNPESVYSFDIAGSADFSVPESASVRFIVEATGAVKVDTNFQASADGKQRIFLAGGGATTVKLVIGGSLRIRQRSYYSNDVDVEFPDGFEDFDEHLEDTFLRLDEHFSNMEAQLNMMPEHVRGRISRKLDAARRKVTEAHRRAAQTVESATRNIDFEDQYQRAYNSGGNAPSEPVGEQERLMILQMVEQGKVTVAEAQKLLEALEGRA